MGQSTAIRCAAAEQLHLQQHSQHCCGQQHDQYGDGDQSGRADSDNLAAGSVPCIPIAAASCRTAASRIAASSCWRQIIARRRHCCCRHRWRRRCCPARAFAAAVRRFKGGPGSEHRAAKRFGSRFDATRWLATNTWQTPGRRSAAACAAADCSWPGAKAGCARHQRWTTAARSWRTTAAVSQRQTPGRRSAAACTSADCSWPGAKAGCARHQRRTTAARSWRTTAAVNQR